METLYQVNRNTSLLNFTHRDFNKNPKRILFASTPADGHFYPLKPLAAYLKQQGHDVRWYTSPVYAEKIAKLRLKRYPFKSALDINGSNVDAVFPERKHIKGLIKKLCFDMIQGYVLRSTEYFKDINEIYYTFPFDIMICDCAFTATPFVKRLLHVPVISIGVFPLTETSKDLAPAGLGLTPAYTFFGKIKQDMLRFITDKILFHKPTAMMRHILKQYGIKMKGSNIFDMVARESTLLLQIGSPGFEYKRADLGKNIRFIGVPGESVSQNKTWYHPKLLQYRKILLVTQGTVEKDFSKLILPALEAFKNTEYLLVVTTGGSHTQQLQQEYNYPNIIIEDFIPFPEIMPLADVYITNGGYGGVMMSIQNKLPIVAAGIHEGKSEINARVGYFNVGINLHTERPTPDQLTSSVEKVLTAETYQTNIEKLSNEFSAYNANELCASYIYEVLGKHHYTA